MIFKHARPNDVGDINTARDRHIYPVALAQVCKNWRTIVLGAPELWTTIVIWMEYWIKRIKVIAHTYLERSKECLISITWLWYPAYTRVVIHHLMTPGAKRLQRINVISVDEKGAYKLFAAIGFLDLPFLQDVKISCLRRKIPQGGPTSRFTPPLHLRHCRLRGVLFEFHPPFLSNQLVILDISFEGRTRGLFNFVPFLEFLPNVAHSLEHLRFGPLVGWFPIPPGKFGRTTLQKLETLLIEVN